MFEFPGSKRFDLRDRQVRKSAPKRNTSMETNHSFEFNTSLESFSSFFLLELQHHKVAHPNKVPGLVPSQRHKECMLFLK